MLISNYADEQSLIIKLNNSTDQIKLKNFFTNFDNNQKVEILQFTDGSTIRLDAGLTLQGTNQNGETLKASNSLLKAINLGFIFLSFCAKSQNQQSDNNRSRNFASCRMTSGSADDFLSNNSPHNFVENIIDPSSASPTIWLFDPPS